MSLTPASATGIATADRLREYSRLTKEFVLDRWEEPLFNFPNVTEHDPDNVISAGTGTADLAELNSSEISAFLLNANNESYGQLWIVPPDCDVSKEISFRILFSNSEAAGTGAILFAGLYTPIVAGGNTAFAIGATALNPIIANKVDLAANVPSWTSYGSIAAGTSAVASLDPGTDMLALKFKVTLDTCADASLIQGSVRYTRKYI